MSVRILMVGYNGANNTGAEALLLRDIQDVRAVFGEKAMITIPTLNEANLRRYVRENHSLRIAPLPALYFGAIRRMVREHDLVMLVEGSTYMDTWGSPLLWAFLWATRCAHSLDRRSLAYAVDAGALSPANQRRVRRTAGLTDLIVTRSAAAADRLRAWGVRSPIEVTADNAFLFEPGGGERDAAADLACGGDRGSDANRAAGRGTGAGRGAVGLAAVDFTLWPAVMRPWGRRENCYRWPYYFSSSPHRSRTRDALVQCYAGLIDDLAENHGRRAVLICMEQLDEPLARRIRAHLRRPDAVEIRSAREHDASEMTLLLRGLELLVTSRFHASVLSLAAGVPQVAVGHDTRLAALYRDLGLGEEWFFDPRLEPLDRLFERLAGKIRTLLDDPGPQRELLRRGYAEQMRRARLNRELLAGFARTCFPEAAAAAGADTAMPAADTPEPAPAAVSSAAAKGGTSWVA
jgi:polysaccharide pyruvyl transferase WcaK-like protein